jgi:hypothetical protein
VDDDVLVIETSWPATVGGEFLLNLSVGPPGGAPENFTYLEFPLSSGHALAQGRPYANRYANR